MLISLGSSTLQTASGLASSSASTSTTVKPTTDGEQIGKPATTKKPTEQRVVLMKKKQKVVLMNPLGAKKKLGGQKSVLMQLMDGKSGN